MKPEEAPEKAWPAEAGDRPRPAVTSPPAPDSRALQSARNLVGSNMQLRTQLDSAMDLVTGVAQGIGKLATATGTARDTAAAMSEAIDGLRVTSLTISDQVNRSQRIAEGVNGHAARARDGVRGLGESVNEIGAIVGMIAGLARQTNLLALNAAIEAARAGEAGRGFSVVAAEVKSLSIATQRATDEISSVIERVRDSAYRSIDDVGALGDAITELHSAFGTVAEALEVQTHSASEIAASAIEASRVAQLVDQERNRVEEKSRRSLDVMKEAGAAARDAHDVMLGLESLFSAAGHGDGVTARVRAGVSDFSMVSGEPRKRRPEAPWPGGPRPLEGQLALSDRVVMVTITGGADEIFIRTDESLESYRGRVGILRVDGVGLLPARVAGPEGGQVSIVVEHIEPRTREALAAALQERARERDGDYRATTI